MIGAKYDAIQKGEDRELFKEAHAKRSVSMVARSVIGVHNMEDARRAIEEIGSFPP